LLVAVGCLVMFLPPLVQSTVASPLKATAVGLTLAVALLLHWVFLAITARRMQRSVWGWVVLGLLFPVGSAMALILLSWFGDEAAASAQT
jgi:drug/metabolite transporter (DMT)-like permease